MVNALEFDLTREDSDPPSDALGEPARWIPEPPRAGRRVLTSGGRSDLSQEAVFEP